MAGYGMLGHVLTQFQNSYGTAVTNSLTALSITDESLAVNIEQIDEAGMYGRLYKSPRHAGMATVGGDLNLEVNPQTIGWALRSVVGCSSVTSDTNKQTHVFKMVAADKDAQSATDLATMEVNRDQGSAALYYDLCGDSLEFSVSNGELLTATWGLMGAGFQKQAAGSPTYQSAKPFKWDQVSATFNGQAINDILDLTITINNNLESRHTLQTSNNPYKIKRSDFQSIEISGTMIFQQHSYWDAYLNETEVPLVLDFKTSQTPNELKFDFPKLRVGEFTPNIGGAGLIEASFTATAEFHTGSNDAGSITLVNTVAAHL